MRQPAQVCVVLALKNDIAPCPCAGAFFIARVIVNANARPVFWVPRATGK